MATSAELSTLINTKIAALIATPQVDYVDGDVEVKAGQKMAQLLQARKYLLQHPDDDLTFMTFDDNINNFGEDLTERL